MAVDMADKAKKRVLILSDNDGLSRAIQLNLDKCLDLEVARLAAGSGKRGKGPTGNGDFDLILVAASSPATEPVVVLAQASLADHIGRVPLLVVSDRPFEADPGNRIVHVGFPFDIDVLCSRVKEMLRG